jgi:hypothetical protein
MTRLFNTKIRGILVIFVWCIFILFSTFIVLVSYLNDQTIGHVVLGILLVINLLPFFNTNIANGRIEYIDMDNNILYFVKSGIVSIKYNKVSFSNITNLRAKKLVRRNSTSYEVTAEIDGNDTLLYKTINRVKCNKLVDTLTKYYSLTCDFEIDTDKFSTDNSIFVNTMYKYQYTPSSYLRNGLLTLFTSLVFFFFDGGKIYFLIFFISSIYSFIVFYKSKENLESIKIKL